MTRLELSSHGVAASPHTSHGGALPQTKKLTCLIQPLGQSSPCPRSATQSPSPGIFGTEQRAGPCCNVWQGRLLRPRVTGGGSWRAKEREWPGSARAPSPLPADKLYPFLSYALVILSLNPQTKNRS